MRGGRTSQRERDEKRRQWELQKKERAKIQAAITRLGKAVTTEELMKDVVLIPASVSPAKRFLLGRWHKGAHCHDDYNQAIVDLVRSDIPLDPGTRQFIADELHRLYFRKAARDRQKEKQHTNWMLEDLENHLIEDRGMTAIEADLTIVEDMGEALGIKSVDALQRRLRPSRR
jgi:hypothetical protein